ncbi:MAG: HAMP domain-containing histidine kinase [Elusimicrobia bacterium]|nr:HAMP domain-containing histidine kinase [Candidatus Liberimonas magnetica]
MRLRTKFSLFSSTLIIIVIAGVSIFLFIAEKRLLIKEMKEKQVTMVKGFGQVSKESLISKDQISLINYVRTIKEERGVVYLVLVDSQNKIMAHSDMSLLGSAIGDSVGLKAQEPYQDIITQMYRDTKNVEIADIALPIVISNERVATARIGFSQDVLNEIIKKILDQTRNRIFGVAGVALLFGLIGSFIMSQIMTRPIKKMVEGARQIGQGKLNTVINVKSKDELGELADDLNLMANQLKELDHMKQDFVSSVTHELRSPMTSIGMNLDLFIEGSYGPLNDEQKNTLRVMRDNASRLGRFINDLLDVAKLERGKMEISPVPMAVNSAIEGPMQLAKVQADAKKIALTAEIPEGISQVYIDSDRIQQVITNLLSNAVKFTPEGGKITIKIKDTSDSFIQVSVCDTGMGIPKDQIEKVFEKFEQVKGTREQIKGPKGTGLGLAIVKALVELHGGKIWAESELKKGSSFNFTLPKYKT